MSRIVESADENIISLPNWLMSILNLREGDEVKTIIEDHTLRITPLDKFLALRGVLKDDQEFDAAMAHLDQAWQEWTKLNSA